MDGPALTLRAMSKEMDRDFQVRIAKAAQHAKVPFTPQSIGSFLSVDRRKAAVWMSGSLPRAEKLFEHADKFGVNPRWYATGKGDMLTEHRSAKVTEPSAVYDASASLVGTTDAEKLLVVVRTFLETDAEGRRELVEAAESIAHGHRGSATRQASQQQRRARRR